MAMNGEDGASNVKTMNYMETTLEGYESASQEWCLSLGIDKAHTLILRASFEGAIFPTQFRGERDPPHRPERLRTVVGTPGDRDRSSSSAAVLGVATKGEWRSYHLCSIVLGPPSLSRLSYKPARVSAADKTAIADDLHPTYL